MSWRSWALRAIVPLLSSFLLALICPLVAFPDGLPSYAPREILVKYKSGMSTKPVAAARSRVPHRCAGK